MLFSGKKYRRVRYEQIELLAKAANEEENDFKSRILSCAAPIICFTKIDEHSLAYSRKTNEGCQTMTLFLDKEQEIQRYNGTKVWITSQIIGSNVLRQKIRRPDGKTAWFTRYFGDKDASMVVTIEGSKVEATIFYERVVD